MELNHLVKALRMGVRFHTNRGPASIEDLLSKDMPLTSKDGYDLDTIARAVFVSLEKEGVQSFVETKVNPNKAKLELMLEVVKYAIKLKQEQLEEARQRATTKAHRDRLVAALAQAESNNLASKSVAELQAELAALEAAN